MEDDDAVRKLVRDVLTNLGYSVLDYSEPSSALSLCEGCLNRIGLLMTDLIMPGMNGRELATRIVAAHPETGVLYMSGYAEESFAKRGVELPDSVFPGKLHA